MEPSKLSDREFKRILILLYKDSYIVIRMLKELGRNYNSVKKEIETINKNKEEMENTMSEIKNTPEGINFRLDKTED